MAAPITDRDKGVVVQVASPETGVVEIEKGGTRYLFEQPYLAELGIREGSKVEVAIVNNGGHKMAVSMILDGATQILGEIYQVNPDKRTGLLITAEKERFRFEQPALEALGLDRGSPVYFSDAGGTNATSLISAGDSRDSKK